MRELSPDPVGGGASQHQGRGDDRGVRVERHEQQAQHARRREDELVDVSHVRQARPARPRWPRLSRRSSRPTHPDRDPRLAWPVVGRGCLGDRPRVPLPWSMPGTRTSWTYSYSAVTFGGMSTDAATWGQGRAGREFPGRRPRGRVDHDQGGLEPAAIRTEIRAFELARALPEERQRRHP